MMRIAVLFANFACLAGFAWAMFRHFEPAGRPRRGMLLTGTAVPVFAALHFGAILVRPLALPRAAILLYATAATLFWWAVAATYGKGLAACFQRRVAPVLVHTGPYRVIRHPFYTSYTLAWIAGFVATAWWPLAITAVIMLCIYARAAKLEESGFLASAWREEYRSYMRRTGRFFPTLPQIQ